MFQRDSFSLAWRKGRRFIYEFEVAQSVIHQDVLPDFKFIHDVVHGGVSSSALKALTNWSITL